MEIVRRFRNCVLAVSSPLVIALSSVLLIYNWRVSASFLLGGVVGVIGFIMMTRDFNLEMTVAHGVKSYIRRWLAIRLLLYAAVLCIGCELDEVHARGLFAAAAGLIVVRIIVTIVGVTGCDLKKPERK
jgi:uncharacterized membrane protein